APSKDRTTPHNKAQAVAILAIKVEVLLRGGNPDNVRGGALIPGASKKRNKNVGYADITYDDGDTIYVWEVKAASESWKGAGEAEWYRRVLEGSGRSAKRGWDIGGPFIVDNDYVVYGSGRESHDDGVVIYAKKDDPRRKPGVPQPAPVPVPVHQPEPEATRVNTPEHHSSWKKWVLDGAKAVGIGVGVGAVVGVAVVTAPAQVATSIGTAAFGSIRDTLPGQPAPVS
ncbi:hypothetical protein ACFQ1S_34355, partial [Kibdelosporangium lantanae]